MNTVSFFSFKGGVGRTNLMLNVAHGLAQRGDFVVIADWDLHAPGFSLNPLFFRSNREIKGKQDVREGVLDFLDGALDPQNQATIVDPASLAQPTELGQQDRAEKRFRKNGDIWSIPAGRFDPHQDVHQYHAQLQRVQGRNLAHWLMRYNTKTADEKINNPHLILDFFRERVETIRHPETGQAPDWLLIDSRTGITEIGDLLLHTEFIDRMVLVSGFNEQNLAGMETVIRSIQAKISYNKLHSVLSLVFGPVPQGEEQLKQERLTQIRTVLAGLARQDENGTAEPIPDLLTIPYHPRIALREEMMLREYPDSEMASAYQRVIEDLRGKTLSPEAIAEQKAQVQADLQDADILPMQPKQSEPKLPAAPFAQLPAWNWPDPSLTSAQFKPALPDEAIRMLNSLACTFSLDKNDKQTTLNNWVKLNQDQKTKLQNILTDERNRIAQSSKNDTPQLFDSYIKTFMEWLDYWVEQSLVERDQVISRLVTGALDAALGAWLKVGFFWYLLAEYLEQKKYWQHAETAYRRAIDSDPNYAPTWNALGNLLTQHLRRYDEAEQAYREAIQRDAQYASPWHGLGSLLLRDPKRYDEAAAAFHQAIPLEQQNQGAGYLCLAELGLIADQNNWLEEGLIGAQQTAKTTQNRQILALLTLGQALSNGDQAAMETAHQTLVTEQAKAKLTATDWVFDDQKTFIARLTEPQRVLYQAWLAAFGTNIPEALEPAAAFSAWQQQQS